MPLINPTGGAPKLQLLARGVIGANQAYTSGTTPIELDNIVRDDGFSFDGETATIPKTATYAVALKARYSGSMSGNQYFAITLNGNNLNIEGVTFTSENAPTIFQANGVVYLDLVAGDTINFTFTGSVAGTIDRGNLSQIPIVSIIEI